MAFLSGLTSLTRATWGACRSVSSSFSAPHLRTPIRYIPNIQKSTNFIRNLNIHEYQSQTLLRKYGISVPDGFVGHSPEEAQDVADKLNADEVVVKAQVLAGGRGKGHFEDGSQGGIQICKKDDVGSIAKKMIGKKLITKQTGPEGKPCNCVLVAKKFSVKKEMYVAVLLDRPTSQAVLVGSPHGGMNIEEVAHENPDAIFKLFLDLSVLKDPNSVPESELIDMSLQLGMDPKLAPEGANQLRRLIKMFSETDAHMIEINPLIETQEGELLFADAKVSIDDNASYRQAEIFMMRDFSQEDPREVLASKYNLNFIGLHGNIGCLVNGAGLAMATMDIIKLKGGEPANFLDIGGGATETQVSAALQILMTDKSVKCVLINVFGGIMRCDVIASGLINAVKGLNLETPLVVRLQGSNVEIGKNLIKQSGLPIITADHLNDAAEKAVAVAKISETAAFHGLRVRFE